MNTTNYILELLISGISSFIWLFLFSLSILGTDTLDLVNYLDDKDRIVIAFLILPIIYTFGVLIDRLVDNVFDKFFNLKLRKKFFINENSYSEARSNIYINSVSLTNLFEYGRIRIRISRNWTFNGLLIYISSIIFLWTSTFTSLSFIGKWKYTIVITFILIPSIILAYNYWKSLLSLFILEPVNSLKKKFLDILKLFRTIFKTIKSPSYLLKIDNKNSKYLSSVDSVKVMLNLIFIILTVSVFYNLTTKEPYELIINEIFILTVYILSIIIITFMSYIWNFTGNFKLEKKSYTTNSLLYLFNSIYFFIFIFNFIFRFEPIVENYRQSKLDNTPIIDARIIPDIELFFFTFYLFIPFYVTYYFFKENKNLNYSKWNIVLLGFFYITIINLLAFFNLIVLQLAFYNKY